MVEVARVAFLFLMSTFVSIETLLYLMTPEHCLEP